MSMPAKLLSGQRRKKFGTRTGQAEEISWGWFATKTYTSGTTTRLTFFDTVETDKTRSNMESAGHFAFPKSFLLYAVRVLPLVEPTVQSGTTQTTAIINIWRDLYRLMFKSYLVLTIGSKEYINMPTHLFPAGSGITGFGFGLMFATTTAQKDVVMHANHGIADPRCVYVLPKKLWIESQINFKVEIIWNTAVTLDAGNTDIQVTMDGKLRRSVQ